MKNDLISRSAVIEYCKRQARDPWNQNAAPVTWADAYVAFADDIEEDFFGVDAVEVVRCKDCKHGRESEYAFAVDTKKPLCDCCYMWLPHQWHGYCSRGERRSDNAD